jgi:hypothetical protein
MAIYMRRLIFFVVAGSLGHTNETLETGLLLSTFRFKIFETTPFAIELQMEGQNPWWFFGLESPSFH